ncbi:MAG: OFA family MFS transporter [Clostridiales bacterium]|nr:OFA family MFS transporter [Clostridiales bacterium]
MNNRWMRAAIPALLIHCSVGTVYCWSIFKEAISAQLGLSTFALGWAFSLAIFFLGMSAAFAGKFVEQDIHKSSLIACICFSVGMVGTGLSIKLLTGYAALIAIYIFYGVIMGIGLGVGYLTPVKTLMLWFSDNKGLATGISIMGFGLAKAIATPVMNILEKRCGVGNMFIILGCFYCVMMFLGHILLRKPEGWVEPKIKEKSNILSIFKSRQFLGIWLMFFINIHCGLMIISYEKQILNAAFAASAALAVIVSVVPSFTAGLNALGRIGYSSISDKLKERNTVYKVIFITCIISSVVAALTHSTVSAATVFPAAVVIAFLLIINAGYGGGFSTLPALLSERFGMKKISRIHGLSLSAWAVAGLTGNNTAEIIRNKTGNFEAVLIVGAVLYGVALIISLVLVRSKDCDANLKEKDF